VGSDRSPKPIEENAPVSGGVAAHPASEEMPDAGQALALEPTAAGTPSDPGTWTGRVIDDRYRIVRPLGEGGMGAVFVAEHLTLHKAVALKVVRAELAGNGEVAARFAREAMATAQFEHPHVASAIDYGTLPEGGAYFVMQLVRGRSLRGLIAGGKRLPWRRACELTAQVADALSAAKAAGIIHRDLKPDNILVERREDGSDLVKVLDFGIAHVAPRDTVPAGAQPHRELTRVGTVMGTPGYMAPEQAVGDKVDHRADLYALGVVLWECIAGRELWDGPDLTTVVTRQLTEPVPRLRDVLADASLPLELDELVQRLVARSAAERPEHAAEVRDTLRRLSHASGPRLAVAGMLAALLTLKVAGSQALARYKAQSITTRVLQALSASAVLALLAVLGANEPKKPPETRPPTMLSKVVNAAQRAVDTVVPPAPAPKPAPPPPKPTLPPELTKHVEKLLEGKTARERRAAAVKVRAYTPQDKVFPYLLVIAELEMARGCKPRKDVIDKMKEQADARYLPALRRLDRAPHSGCGFLSLADCQSCIRADLREAIDALERVQTRPDTQP
jgi:serine/threonine protein kinase